MRPSDPLTVVYVRVLPLLPLVTLAVLTLFAGTAQASCGDYLVFGGGNHVMEQSADARNPETSQRQPLDAPCHGPRCQRLPATPSPPLPVESGQGQHERALVQQLSDSLFQGSFWYRAAETSARAAVGFPFRLERPPKT